MRETTERFKLRLLAYCLMPNHWHMVLWPREDGDLGRFMQRLTTTHVRRWRLHRGSVGEGHLYQGTYKSFPIQQDEHFLTVCRYVERNALRANLAKQAQDWRWSSLGVREMTQAQAERENKPILTDWPVERPRQWLRLVNEPQSKAEMGRVTSIGAARASFRRGCMGETGCDPARAGVDTAFPGPPAQDKGLKIGLIPFLMVKWLTRRGRCTMAEHFPAIQPARAI